MNYIVVNKQPLKIFDELAIPIPYSHPIEGRVNALKWMSSRGLQAECRVMSEAQFIALNGELPK